MKQPNLLYLLSDDHADYAWGAGGDPRAITPNLDRLASQGVRFANNFCQYPVCTPSRQSFFTGRMPHGTGVTRLKTPLEDGFPTLARHLKDQGYQTAVSGKMHFNVKCYDGLHGFDWCKSDMVQYHDREFGGEPGTQPKWRPFIDPAEIWLNAGGLPYPADIGNMPNSKVADRAITWLKNRDKDKPFALWTGFNQPHSPFFFPREMQGMFDPADFPAPVFPETDRSQIPLAFNHLTPEQISGITAAYYTAVHFLDYSIGRMLDTLEEEGLAENTVVIYMTDHGFLTGQHGRLEKHCLYDEAIRIPLTIRYPDRIKPGTVFNGLTESLDVPGTLLELMELGPLPEDQGRSLIPLIEDPDQSGRDKIFSELLENEEACLRSEKWKLIYCSGKRARRDGMLVKDPTPGRYLRLFDLENDPQEFIDVSEEQPKLVQEYLAEMLQVFRDTHPEAQDEPADLTIEDTLDWYLRPRDPNLPT